MFKKYSFLLLIVSILLGYFLTMNKPIDNDLGDKGENEVNSTVQESNLSEPKQKDEVEYSEASTLDETDSSYSFNLYELKKMKL